jgi:type I restriction enzyme M protein
MLYDSLFLISITSLLAGACPIKAQTEDTKSGAGQYFTPRPLIRAIVDVMRPEPGKRICDPAAGTGGFLLASHDYIIIHNQLDPDQKRFLKHDALNGWEIVDNTARLCVMNLFLHGIGSDENNGKSPIRVADSLRGHPGETFDIVMTNPPFGRKSSVTFANEEGREERESKGAKVPNSRVFVNVVREKSST